MSTFSESLFFHIGVALSRSSLLHSLHPQGSELHLLPSFPALRKDSGCPATNILALSTRRPLGFFMARSQATACSTVLCDSGSHCVHFIDTVSLCSVTLILTSEYESALGVELQVKFLDNPFSKPKVPVFLQVSWLWALTGT